MRLHGVAAEDLEPVDCGEPVVNSGERADFIRSRLATVPFICPECPFKTMDQNLFHVHRCVFLTKILVNIMVAERGLLLARVAHSAVTLTSRLTFISICTDLLRIRICLRG